MLHRPRKRVKLLCDLTRYDRRLVAGSLGWTGEPGQWGNMVSYDCGARLDTLWRSLEVLEDETHAEALRLRRLDFAHAVEDLLKGGMAPAVLRQEITRLSHEIKKEQRADERRRKSVRPVRRDPADDQ